MLFQCAEQKRWNDKLNDELINCVSPAITQMRVDASKLPALPCIMPKKEKLNIKLEQKQDISMDNNNKDDVMELSGVYKGDKNEISDSEVSSKDDGIQLIGVDNGDKNQLSDGDICNTNENDDSKSDIMQALKHNPKLWMTETHELDPGLRTMQFWLSKQQLVHFDRIHAIKLPKQFDLKLPKKCPKSM